MVYWLKYVLFLATGFVAALLLEGKMAANELQTLPGFGTTSAIPGMWLVGLAATGRLADVTSTVLALRNDALSEGAPGLGPRPTRAQLIAVLAWQVTAIGGGLILGIALGIPGTRVVAVMVSVGSVGAAISNILLWAMHPVLPGSWTVRRLVKEARIREEQLEQRRMATREREQLLSEFLEQHPDLMREASRMSQMEGEQMIAGYKKLLERRSGEEVEWARESRRDRYGLGDSFRSLFAFERMRESKDVQNYRLAAPLLEVFSTLLATPLATLLLVGCLASPVLLFFTALGFFSISATVLHPEQ